MKNANEQDWWINATERPPVFDDLCAAFVEAGLCSWDARTRPHPQSYALVAITTMSAPTVDDSFERIADDAIAELQSEELVTEQEFGIGDPSENYFEGSQRLRARFRALGGKSQHKAFGEDEA